jgi:hypothetical protein
VGRIEPFRTTATRPTRTDGPQTLRWREMDSNVGPWRERAGFGGESELRVIETGASLKVVSTGYRWFESTSLQRGVRCELDPTASATCLLRATRPHRR